MKRKCNKCNIEKELNCFYKRNDNGKYKNECKDCLKERTKKYYQENNEKMRNHNKKYYEDNKDRLLIIYKKYKEDNKEHYKKYNKEYYQKNKKKINNKHLKYLSNKILNDELFKLKESIRNNIRNSFKRKKYKKTSRTHEILGCDYWDNYGKYDGNFNTGWDLDHIKPISLGKTEEEIIKLNHYTNFQPLCSHINRDIKKDKY